MKHWFKDQHFRSLLKNTSYLAISRVVAAVCSLATLAFAGRGLGVIMFGMLILITSYAKAASGIAKFQSWQLLVRYGGRVAHDNPEDFKTATGFAFALDVLSGIAGMLIAVAILPFIARWLGISPEYLWLGMLYCTLLPTMGAATPNGVLRVLDRFDLISWTGTVTPIGRAMLAAIAFVSDAPFAVYVAIWYVTDLAGDLYTWYLGWREMRLHGLLKGITPTLRPTTLPGAWKFAINVNLAASVQTVWGPMARLVVGGLLGPAGAALFRVASSLADRAQKPADLLGRAFYPEVMRMDLSSNKPWKLMIRGTALVSAICLLAIILLLLGGKPLIALLFGKAFTGAYAPLVILMILPFLGILSFPLTPMLYALGKAGAPLRAKIYGSVVFFLTIAPLAWRFDIVGAAIALVLGNAVNVGVMLVQLRGEHRQIPGESVKRPRIWLLIGTRRGDNNQVLALGEALGVPFETRTVFYKWTARLRMKLVPIGVGHLTAASRRWLQPPWPDVVVGIGRRTVPVARWIQQQSGGRTSLIRLGHPRADNDLFDLVITTRQYPVPPGDNVVTLPLAMNRFRKPPAPTAEEQAWLDARPRPHLLLSLGGTAPMWRLDLAVLRLALRKLVGRAQQKKGTLIVVGSPRTPKEAWAIVREMTAGTGNVAWVEKSEVRYPVLLNDADEQFVTADSVSMISEAVITGKPIGLIPVEPDARGRRIGNRDPEQTKVRDPRRFWKDVHKQKLVGTVDQPVRGKVKEPVEVAVAAIRKALPKLFG